MSPSPDKALLVFARSPRPGRVKTRLTPPLTPDEAAELYRCMLEDTLDTAATLPGVTPILFYVDEGNARNYFETVASGFSLFPQKGNDLGERMAAAFRQVFAVGCRLAVIIGTDSPDLPVSRLSEAFARLDDGACDVLFGPTEDGGYYLLGMRQMNEGLFRGIRWSSADVLRESMEQAREARLRVSLLPAWHDVDTAADLCRPSLVADESPAGRTRDFLCALMDGGRLSAG